MAVKKTFEETVVEYLTDGVFRTAISAEDVSAYDRDAINEAFDHPLIMQIPNENTTRRDMLEVEIKLAAAEDYISIEGDGKLNEMIEVWVFDFTEKGKKHFFSLIQDRMVERLEHVIATVRSIKPSTEEEHAKSVALAKKTKKMTDKAKNFFGGLFGKKN